MKYNETIESAIVTWVKAITGLECVAEQQKYRGTVTGSFCSYNILAPIKYGQDDMWSDADVPDKLIFMVRGLCLLRLRYMPTMLCI